jgi:transcriptional regulator with XRE-family HTH domain
METLGQHVRQRRKALGMATQKVLADKLGWHQTYISHIERDRGKRPSFPLLVQLATALGESVDDLLEATGLREKYASELGLPATSPGSKLLLAYVQANFPDLSEEEAQQAMDTLAGVFRRRQPKLADDRQREDEAPDVATA